ncbi:MAG: S8 family serine peptidase [Lachnospiraceae bacterium]|nr:S8 family serine peptidase [Lachnospiraceae bacterium]
MKKIRKRIAVILCMTYIGNIFSSMPIQGEEKKQDYSEYEKANTYQVIVERKEQSAKEFYYKGCQVEQLTEEYWQIEADSKETFGKLMRNLENRKDVLSVQPNYEYSVMDVSGESNDAYFEKQWGLYNDGTIRMENEKGDIIQALKDMDLDAKEAWDTYTSDNEVIVAVLDTGVDNNHEDLQECLWKNPGEIEGNSIDDDGNGFIDDVYGWDFYNNDNTICSYNKKGNSNQLDNDDHGTHCVGTIAATANNQIGIAGVASNVNVKILPVKILGGMDGTTSTAMIIKGIRYAISMNASVINASWGGETGVAQDGALKNIIASSGVLFVTAVGNDGKSCDEIHYTPACYCKELDNVISVGSLDWDGNMSFFSNYGDEVEILAPGGNIYSTVVGGYGYFSGTSMAAPMVSAVAAMLYTYDEKTYPATVKAAILNHTKKLDKVQKGKVSTGGMVSAKNAVDAIFELETDTLAPVISKLYCNNYGGKIYVETYDEGTAGIAGVYYQKGNKTEEDFYFGGVGTLVNGNIVTVSSSGSYTFYVKDQAGNEVVQNISVTIDKKAPKLTVKKKKNKYNITAEDAQAGIDIVAYAYGKKGKAYFRNGNGKTIARDVKKAKKTLTKKSTKNNKYITIYGKDIAGNEKIKVIKL